MQRLLPGRNACVLYFVFAVACSSDGANSGGRDRGSADQNAGGATAASGTNGGAGTGASPAIAGAGTGGDGAAGETDPSNEPETDICGTDCFETGVGEETPFNLDKNPAENVALDDDGALILKPGEGSGKPLIWVANTHEHTVSKFDTESFVELGRYRIPGISDVKGNGPSRTSVDSEGNVYAGARIGSNLTKISAAGDACPDSNGDGTITTSAGGGDLLAEGQDDCLIWQTEIGHDARGVAVQEVPGKLEIEPVVDGDPIITETPSERYVWVGGMAGDYMLHKLDAETGTIVFSIKPPAAVYGLALDGRGNLWTAGRHGTDMTALGRIDTTRCVDASCASEMVCVTNCNETTCPDACDDAVVERIEVGNMPYGITVDCKQRVWAGHAHGGSGVTRYDPLQPANMRLMHVAVPGANNAGVNGIAADANGWIWGASNEAGVWRINAESLEFAKVAGTGVAGFHAKGIAVDRQGKVWGIPLFDTYAIVIEPGPGINDSTITKPVSTLVGPYTYSDMTGEQRRLATNEPGHYRRLFEGCGTKKPTLWEEFDWDVDVPDGTVVVFRARTADKKGQLDKADWVNLVAAPGSDAPVDIDPYFDSAGVEPGRYIEVEVKLITEDAGGATDNCAGSEGIGITPRVKSFALRYRCDADLQ